MNLHKICGFKIEGILKKQLIINKKKNSGKIVIEFSNSDQFEMLSDLLIKKKKKVSSYPITEYWRDIGTLQDFKKAQNDICGGTARNRTN